MSKSVLVVEDDADVRDAIGQSLELAGYEPILTSAFVVAKDHISRDFDGVIVSDMRMPGRDGMYLLSYAQSVDPDLPVILLTGEGDIPMAVEATQKGAFAFLEKPCSNAVLMEMIEGAQELRATELENRLIKAKASQGDVAERMIFGQSDTIVAVRAAVRRMAVLDGPVLIQGAPGAGVSKCAEVVHRLSDMAAGPFGRVVAAGLTPAGLNAVFDENAGGSIYIDEIAQLTPEVQSALLAALEGGVGPRILAGTVQDIKALPAFNMDLFYRLEALNVYIPSLKERPEDIPVLFRHYVLEASEQSGVAAPPVTQDVLADLLAQDWPGNARALMNAAMRFVLGLSTDQTAQDTGLAAQMQQVERSLLVDALRQNHGNASATASQLKLPRKTFYDKLAKHGLKPGAFR